MSEYSYKGEEVSLSELLECLNRDDEHPERGEIKTVEGCAGGKIICRGNQENGVYETWHKNGQLYARANYRDGKLEDDSVWDDNGTLRERYKFMNDTHHDQRETWNKYGTLCERTTYKNGVRDGLHEEWWYDGQIITRENYLNGKEHGLAEHWYLNGQVSRRINFFNGQLHGLHESWHENGQLAERAHYKAGKRDGLCQTWDKDGHLKITWFYKNDYLVASGAEALKLAEAEKQSQDIANNDKKVINLSKKKGKTRGVR